MTYFRNFLGMLAFRSRSLHALASRRSLVPAVLFFSIGFLAFVLVRNSLFPNESSSYVRAPIGILESLLDIHLLQMLLFLSAVYVPLLVAMSNAFAGDGLGFSISRSEYSSHLSALLPLWGMLFLAGAPMLPLFVILGYFDLSAGELWLMLSMAVYTIWGVMRLNYISVTLAMSVFGISLLTLPILFVLTNYLLSVPFFVLIPLLYIFLMRVRELMATKLAERDLVRHLRSLALNPRDADAHYQMGLLHFRRGTLDVARGYFEQALAIEAGEAEFHYGLGRVHEVREDWVKAAAAYEEAYRLRPDYGQGDIFREVGKGYLHTGQLEKAMEFLHYFLERRNSDPEGRYWLAVAQQKAGRIEEMRSQLNTVLEQARSNPRFFRKENRQWLYRSRMLLRGQTLD